MQPSPARADPADGAAWLPVPAPDSLPTVEELLTTLVGTLDIRDVFTRVSEVVGGVLKHDAISLPVLTEDRQHVIPLATAGPAAGDSPVEHPIPEAARGARHPENP